MLTSPALFALGNIERGRVFASTSHQLVQPYFAKQVKLAHKITRGEFNGKGVTETERGFIITDLKLWEKVHTLPRVLDRQMYGSRIGLAKALKRLGYETWFVYVDSMGIGLPLVDESLLAELRGFGVDRLIPVEIKNPREIDSLSWLRDMAVHIGDKIFVTGNAGRIDWVYPQALNLDGEVRISYLGTGGGYLFGEDFALMSSCGLSDGRPTMKHDFQGSINRDFFDAGIRTGRIFHLPMQIQDICPPELMKLIGLKRRIFSYTDHVDLEAVLDKGGSRIAFNEAYYRANSDRIDAILDRLKFDTVTLWPDVSSFLANPSDLPLGGLLFDRASTSVAAAFVRDGWNVHLTEEKHGIMGGNGGARCSTTFLWVRDAG